MALWHGFVQWFSLMPLWLGFSVIAVQKQPFAFPPKTSHSHLNTARPKLDVKVERREPGLGPEASSSTSNARA